MLKAISLKRSPTYANEIEVISVAHTSPCNKTSFKRIDIWMKEEVFQKKAITI